VGQNIKAATDVFVSTLDGHPVLVLAVDAPGELTAVAYRLDERDTAGRNSRRALLALLGAPKPAPAASRTTFERDALGRICSALSGPVVKT